MSDLEYISIITEKNFQTEVKESNVPVLVDFWAEWCGPCIALAPVLAKIAEENKGKLKVCKVNVEENPQLAATFNIRNIPYMAFIKDGQVVANLVGNQPKQVIDKQVQEILSAQ